MTKIVAKALVRNSEGLYLVLHRGNTHPRFPGHIDFPGGEVEPKETPETAVIREIQEETGLLVDPKKLKKLFTKQYRQTTHKFAHHALVVVSDIVSCGKCMTGDFMYFTR